MNNNISSSIPQKIQALIHHTEGDNSKWGRIDAVWIENKSGEQLTHEYFALINKETGDIYLDCSKKKIYVKLLTHAIVRPILIFGKTLYHTFFFISIPHIIAKTVINGKAQKLSGGAIATQCLKNSFKSLADIVRTPAYGVAMLVVSATALIIGPLAPRSLYTLREAIGALVQSLNWNDREEYMNDVFLCFQPLRNIERMKTSTPYDDDRTVYPNGDPYEDESVAIMVGLSNYARQNVEFRRNNRSPFNDCFRKLNPNEAYVSQAHNSVVA